MGKTSACPSSSSTSFLFALDSHEGGWDKDKLVTTAENNPWRNPFMNLPQFSCHLQAHPCVHLHLIPVTTAVSPFCSEKHRLIAAVMGLWERDRQDPQIHHCHLIFEIFVLTLVCLFHSPADHTESQKVNARWLIAKDKIFLSYGYLETLNMLLKSMQRGLKREGILGILLYTALL